MCAFCVYRFRFGGRIGIPILLAHHLGLSHSRTFAQLAVSISEVNKRHAGVAKTIQSNPDV